jgi:hypothetical protein
LVVPLRRRFVSGGKEGESVWHRSQQGILTDCLDEESDLQVHPHHHATHPHSAPLHPSAHLCCDAAWQCRVVDVFRGLKEGMEADLDQATQRLGLPEHAAHAHTEVRPAFFKRNCMYPSLPPIHTHT